MLSSLALECVVRVSVGHGALGSWRTLLIILLTRLSGISWRAPARGLCFWSRQYVFQQQVCEERELIGFNPDQMFLVGHLSND